MRIQYLFQLKDPIRLEDHWPVSILGGHLRIVSKGEYATAFEITFSNQPVEFAPAVEETVGGNPRLLIRGRDALLPLLRMQLVRAFSYLQCYFDVEILIKEIDVKYTAETQQEENQIDMGTYSIKQEKRPLPLSFDFLTRAIMAAEGEQAPEFEATLLNAARTAMLQERYIDSFRYSFLLIESLYGDGKHKSVQLKAALKDNTVFRGLVSRALITRMSPKSSHDSETETLLGTSPSVELVIDHLVDQRGYYFHGNVKRKDAWQPHAQQAAEALALLSLEIASLISQEAATPMFDEALSQRHFDNAKSVGAIMALNVKFEFREPDENFDRNETMRISVPGTVVTPKMAAYVARNFLDRFEYGAPTADLKLANCTVDGSGQKVFDIVVHVDSGQVVDENSEPE